MPTNYPAAQDTSVTLPKPLGPVSSPAHEQLHANEIDAILALEANTVVGGVDVTTAGSLIDTLAVEQIMRLNSLDQFSPPAADLNFNNHRLTNGSPPLFPTDFALLSNVLAPNVVTTNAPGGTPSISVSQSGTSPPTMFANFTGLATNITSMSTNLTGTPVTGQLLTIGFTDNGTARTITWGASFAAGDGVGLPGTTLASTLCLAQFIYTGSIWQIVRSWCDNAFVSGGTLGASPVTVTPDSTHPVLVMISTGASATISITCNGNAIFPSNTAVAHAAYTFRCPAGASFTMTYSAGTHTYTTQRVP